MLPYLYIGGLTISMRWFCIGLGMVLSVLLVVAQRKLYRFSVLKAVLATVSFIVVGFLLCVLIILIDNSTVYTGENLYHMNMDYFGAILFLPILVPLIGKPFGLSWREGLNICAKALALIRAFLRVGCYCVGCCGGMAFTVLGATFHWPTRLLGSVGCFLIFLFLLDQEKRQGQDADLYPLFLVTYCTLRFVQEFMMGKETLALGLNLFQFYSLIGFAAGVLFLIRDQRKKRAGAAGAVRAEPGTASAE